MKEIFDALGVLPSTTSRLLGRVRRTLREAAALAGVDASSVLRVIQWGLRNINSVPGYRETLLERAGSSASEPDRCSRVMPWPERIFSKLAGNSGEAER